MLPEPLQISRYPIVPSDGFLHVGDHAALTAQDYGSGCGSLISFAESGSVQLTNLTTDAAEGTFDVALSSRDAHRQADPDKLSGGFRAAVCLPPTPADFGPCE